MVSSISKLPVVSSLLQEVASISRICFLSLFPNHTVCYSVSHFRALQSSIFSIFPLPLPDNFSWFLKRTVARYFLPLVCIMDRPDMDWFIPPVFSFNFGFEFAEKFEFAGCSQRSDTLWNKKIFFEPGAVGARILLELGSLVFTCKRF
jgi:hypothetical protein